ncbi:hypothetical protein VM98_33895, partial [Streptomyces rubellomurinus subsp. indigoferus]
MPGVVEPGKSPGAGAAVEEAAAATRASPRPCTWEPVSAASAGKAAAVPGTRVPRLTFCHPPELRRLANLGSLGGAVSEHRLMLAKRFTVTAGAFTARAALPGSQVTGRRLAPVAAADSSTAAPAPGDFP